jgi:serine phosphatase RsbU (regulator of sigma subunit)/DNA-binding NarL/FixJ family response regulator
VSTGTDQPVDAVVLVVDDNTASRYVACSWLRRHDYRVLEAETGTEALAVLAREPVDIVVLDVGLPDMSGFDVCERIKTDAGMGQPVIHLSATAVRAADRVSGLSRGADAYLTEPVEPGELMATIDAVLRYYRARAKAEELADRLTQLSRIVHALHAATGFEQLAGSLATGTAALFGARAMALVPTLGGIVRRAVADVGQNAVVDAAPQETARTLQAEALAQADGPTVRRRSIPATEDEPAWQALLVSGRPGNAPLCIAIGVTALTDEQTTLLTQLGQAATLAADALRLYAEEHSLALTLQRSFLPERTPRIPGLEIAARYVPAAETAEIGGDFYDVIELGGGRLLIAIGDVAGHSIHAATIMVELRHALRAYAVEDHGPAAIVGLIERTLLRYHPTEFATLCILLLDTTSNGLQVVNAGHLPPLIVDETGAHYLDIYGPMLGLGAAELRSTDLVLPASWSIVLVTDGLVEEPGLDLDTAMETLRTSVRLDLTPEQLCTRLLARFSRRLDDIALLVLRKPPPDAP